MSTTELVNVYSRIFILTLTSLCFSVVLLICGFLSIHFQSRFYFVGHAIWGAMFYILSSYSAFLAVRCKAKFTDDIHTYFSLISWLVGIAVGGVLTGEIIEDRKYNYWIDPTFCPLGCCSSDDDDDVDSDSDDPYPNYDRYILSCHKNLNAVWIEITALFANFINFAIHAITGFIVSVPCCRRPYRDFIQPVPEATPRSFDQTEQRKMNKSSKFIQAARRKSQQKRTLTISRV